MIRNYIKIAWRNLVRHKTLSLINIGGLAVGMAVAMLIGLWMWDELRYDTYHAHYDRLAQVMSTQTFNGETSTGEAVAVPVANELKTKYANYVERTALVFPKFTHVLAIGDKKIAESGVWAQPDLPDMLTLHMLRGNRDALVDPSSVLIAQSVATSLFGKTNPINRIVRLDNHMDVKVAGVFDDLPRNTTFHNTKLFLSWNKAVTFIGGMEEAQTQWDNRFAKLFVQLRDQVDPAKVSALIEDMPKNHIAQGRETVLLHPMAKWHLYSSFVNGQVAGGRIQYVWLFGIIGGFVLLLACINFMNLATARSEKRAKEIGIRKAAGSVRSQLIGQFLSESLLMTLLALVGAILLVLAATPLFNQLAQKTIVVPWFDPTFWSLLLLFTMGTGLLAGSYPAFYLSGFKIIAVLKGGLRSSGGQRATTLTRRTLVTIQFTVSICLLIGTALVYLQLEHARNRPVGYAREGLLSIKMNTPELFGAPYNALRDELLRTGVVVDMAKASASTTETPYADPGFAWAGKAPGAVSQLRVVWVTHDYGNTLGWKLKTGRDFSRQFTTDSSAVIINEAAAKLMGFKEPVGQLVQWKNKAYTVAGVINDIVMESPYKPVEPTVFTLDYTEPNAILLRLRAAVPVRDALAAVTTVFKRYNPGGVVDFAFTDVDYAQKFSDEERIGSLSRIFSVLAIFISCLGLFGLASFVAESRAKEIGVRKVLGASVLNVWTLLSREFLVLVVIALVIAAPITYYAMSRWLQDFAYRITIAWWVFALAGLVALVVALLTVSFQSVKAALTNPVKVLRSE